MAERLDIKSLQVTLDEIAEQSKSRHTLDADSMTFLKYARLELNREARTLLSDNKQLTTKITYAGVVDFIAALTFLVSVFLSFPLWAQMLVALILVASIILTLYLLWRSGDFFGNLFKIIELILKILEIIDDVTPDHKCPSGQHWDESLGKCVPDVTPPDPPTEDPPGITHEPFGDITLYKVGGEHQVDMQLALDGGKGWPGLTVKVMDASDPEFDIMPNFLWAYWYDGTYGVPGWYINKQSYYYLDNPNALPKNHMRSIKDTPWIQPGDPLMTGIPQYLTSHVEKREGKLVAVMKNGNRVTIWEGKK
jgi:hypothetical protein